MSEKDSKKGSGKGPSEMPFKFREDTIPVIVVNGVYYPSQKLRFKLNDPQLSFRKISHQKLKSLPNF